MKMLLVACALLLSCTPDRTAEEDLALCRTICGERPIEAFSHASDFGGRLDCRCGELKLVCDASACGTAR